MSKRKAPAVPCSVVDRLRTSITCTGCGEVLRADRMDRAFERNRLHNCPGTPVWKKVSTRGWHG